MKRNRSLPRCLAFLAAVAALSLSMAFTAGVGVSASGPRPDVLTLDGGLAPGKAKLPPVSFLHDAHTEATMQNGWNCAMCHADISAKNPSYKFKRAGVRVSPDDVQAYYHQGCISCHDNVSGAPGIASCHSCHDSAQVVAAHAPTNFMDNGQHDAHMESEAIVVAGADANCGACHHVFDAASGKLVPEEDPSEGCASCHQEKAVENPEKAGSMIPSLVDASHLSCITCHVDMSAKSGEKNKYPYTCAGCHGQKAAQ